MKALVTGGCGFIGSHMVDLLLEKEFTVTVIDNLSTGRLANLDQHKENPQLDVHVEDINNTAKVEHLFENANYVFHLAALADIVPSIERPLNYYTSNVTGTVNILEMARKAGVKNFLYAASSSCYGIPDMYPTPETADIRPQYPYALTKNLGEQCVQHWHQIYHLPTVCLRFFNVYGPRSRTSGTYGAVFGVFLAQKLAGRPFTVVGDGMQTRDFTYVTDVVQACLQTIECEEAGGHVFNVGSGNTYSVNRLVELLRGPVEYIPKRPGEPDCTSADTKKIRGIVGWQPKVSFEDGVASMYENIDYWKEAPVWDKDSIGKATERWFNCLGKD